MKPPPFEYCRADTVDEALALLAEFGEEASVLAGGLSLGAMLNMRLVRPAALIDINRLESLSAVRTGSDAVETGALVRQDAPELPGAVPMLALALPYVGHYQTRSRGTLGGSVAHADPSAEIPLCLTTLGGAVRLRSPRGARSVPARDFFRGVLTTDRRPDELIESLAWPRCGDGTVCAFEEIAQRHGDFAIAAAAVSARVGEDGCIAALSLGLGGVEDRPIVADTKAFLGRLADNATVRDIAEAAAEAADPVVDLQGNADYRRQLVRVLGARALSRAFGIREDARCSA